MESHREVSAVRPDFFRTKRENGVENPMQDITWAWLKMNSCQQAESSMSRIFCSSISGAKGLGRKAMPCWDRI